MDHRLSAGLHDRVAQHALDRPTAVAVVSGERRVTYEELNSRADGFAAQLVSRGVGPRDLVPILLPRGIDLIACLLAVLKTGAAYSLLDPEWPLARTSQIIDQLQAPLLIAEDAAVAPGLAPVWTPPGGALSIPRGFHCARVDDSDPCCVFFTSGTTGRPKGVLTPHRATARLFPADGGFAQFGPDTVIPLAAPVPWDAFSLELWGALLPGGVCVVVAEPYLSAQTLRSLIGPKADIAINTAWLTSSLFNMVVEEDLDAFTGLDQVMIGGERLSPAHVARFLQSHPTIALLNGYGPVESTVFATTHRIELADCALPAGIPLGRPVPGTRVFVLDGTRPCGGGEVGEICLAGHGLALGYVAAPEETAEKYQHLKIGEDWERVYRTGDLGEWDDAGRLHFRGRADRQVKIRGHRVEPAEVERQIERSLPDVRQCRVVPLRDDQGNATALAAFCVPVQPRDPLEGALAILRSALVSYHQPTAVISVDSMPLTRQGKLDEATLLALLEQRGSPDHGRGAVTAPDDEIARTIWETYTAVLATGSVPLDVPFFELGGDSLDAGRACARLSARLGRAVPISLLYRHPTVAALAAQLHARETAAPTPAPMNPEHVPLSGMQLIYLTRQLIDPDDLTGYCLMTWQIRGTLDRQALTAAVTAVHSRHEALRCAYLADPSPHARLADVAPPRLAVLDAAPSPESAIAELRRFLSQPPIQIAKAEVWRVALVPIGSGEECVFGCVIHHIAFDGWSESVLAGDLAAEYNAEVTGERSLRPAPPSIFAVHRELAAQAVAADQGVYLDRLSADLAGLPDLCWPAGDLARGGTRPRQLDALIDALAVSTIDEIAKRSRVTRFVVLLFLWSRSLAEVTGRADFAIGVPVAQRYGLVLERAVGCHINMVAIRMRGAALEGPPAGIPEVARLVRAAFETQEVSFADVVQRLNRPRTGRPALFQTLFALQDNGLPHLELVGAETIFHRQPYLGLPLELHAELWPRENGDLHLVVSFRPEAVPEAVAEQVATTFARHVAETLAQEQP